MADILKSLQDYHASHDCAPAPCACKCGCTVQLGCTALGGLCSRCHIDHIWDEGDHGFRTGPAAPNVGTQEK